MDSSTPDHLSVKTYGSGDERVAFNQEEQAKDTRVEMDSATADCLSMKSEGSMVEPVAFNRGEQSTSEKIGNWLFEELLKCSVCVGLLKDPVSMSCGHTYCRSCITTFQTQYGEGACAKCRKRSRRSSVLHTNKALAELIEKMTSAQICFAEPGYVEPCRCQKHNRTSALFCKSDRIAICKECALEGHRHHEKQYLKIAAVPDTWTTLQNFLDSMSVSEFRQFKRNLSHEYPECFETLEVNCSVQYVAERMIRSFSEDQVLKVTFQLASVKKMLKCQEKIKEKFRMGFKHIHEGLALQKTKVVLQDIYTELYITEGGSDAVQSEHEVRLIEKAAKNFSKQETPVRLTDIFKTPSGSGDNIRMVLMKGIAGIGKTVSVQKFILDWAENKTNQDIDLILPLSFRDLNLEKKDCSLMELLQGYFPELSDAESIENGIKVLLVLHALDECRLSLDFENTRNCSDVMEPASVDVLLTNLIRGNLLPCALLWITSCPAATKQIPSKYVQRVTEVRGFNDLQKVEYFQKKCTNSDLANTMIKHVKSSRSIDMMCHIPIFCWIMATVLDIMLKDTEIGEIPKNQTQLYTHYLLIQIGLKNRRYQKAMHEDLRKLSECDKMVILNLAKLAFQELEKGNFIFYEDDLKECGIDISDALDLSSVCTQLFREEFGFYRERVFCFLHLSVQEYLAAVHVMCMYLNEGINVLQSDSPASTKQQVTLTDVLKSAVVKALESKNGHFDQFLRFFLGLSVESNQKLLQGLLHHPQNHVQKCDEIVCFIKSKISEEDITETATINLFHCLSEMNHDCLVQDIWESSRSGTLSEKELKPVECSALAFAFLMSEDVTEVFDLKEYRTKPSSRQRLLPIIRASKKVILSGCELSVEACETVASALRIGNSPVRELDLSNSNIGDSGVRHICSGLRSPHCRLEILRLADCKITAKSCESLASTLQGTESNLLELDLSVNKLTDSGMKVLEPWLRSEQCKVQRMGLRQCHLTKDYCRSLNEVLSSCQTKQMDVDLRGNDQTN
ncbi:hypothetical protein AOLI_G00314910 [Acnodon oligacanthus]